jgi:hypothetical protein
VCVCVRMPAWPFSVAPYYLSVSVTRASSARPPATDAPCARSPWSNEYNPPLPDGAMPSERLRRLEVQANEAFDTYREMYYEGGISSVYLWDLDKGFAAVVLIKKGACPSVLCPCACVCVCVCICTPVCLYRSLPLCFCVVTAVPVCFCSSLPDACVHTLQWARARRR